MYAYEHNYAASGGSGGSRGVRGVRGVPTPRWKPFSLFFLFNFNSTVHPSQPPPTPIHNPPPVSVNTPPPVGAKLDPPLGPQGSMFYKQSQYDPGT